MSVTVRFKNCEEPPCPALQKLGVEGRVMWAVVRGTELTLGASYTPEQTDLAGGLTWDFCGSDRYWRVAGGFLFDITLKGGNAGRAAVCRHMIEIGD